MELFDHSCIELCCQTLALIGLVKITLFFWQIITKGYQYLIRSSKRDFKEYQGTNSWAIISGGSEGIGKEFGLVLGRAGFNICLISRSIEKLNNARADILNENSSIEVRVIQHDFLDPSEMAYDRIMSKIGLPGEDIAILVNNVGLIVYDYHHHHRDQDLRKYINIGCMPQAILTKRFLPKLIHRTKRSAIVNLSSYAGFHPSPGRAMYCATKAFNDYLSQGLSEEYKESVDILSFRPRYISTPLTHNIKPSFSVLTTQEAVECCLRDLGKERYTIGSWRHAIDTWYQDLWSLNSMLRNRMKISVATLKDRSLILNK